MSYTNSFGFKAINLTWFVSASPPILEKKVGSSIQSWLEENKQETNVPLLWIGAYIQYALKKYSL